MTMDPRRCITASEGERMQKGSIRRCHILEMEFKNRNIEMYLIGKICILIGQTRKILASKQVGSKWLRDLHPPNSSRKYLISANIWMYIGLLVVKYVI